jgi:hypothetical protein
MDEIKLHFGIAGVQDIAGVLALQELNLYDRLSEAERKKEGFVTTPFTPQQLEEVIGKEGLFVGRAGDQVMGYAFAGTWAYFEQWPIFPYMVSRFPNLNFQGKEITTANSFQYGPVCIAKEYRGQGWFNHIFEAMRLVWAQKYPISITFINQVNERSVAAHVKKLGWTIIDEFGFNDKRYYGLGFDMNSSVL